MWKICNQELNRGEKKEVFLDTGLSAYQLPAILCCGAREGKTLLVTAQIHALEHNGTPAVIRTAKALDPEKLSGNVIFLPCVNLNGFWKEYPRILPEDGFNLNGNFPSKEGCETGNALAGWFIREIFPHIDFIADLHGGSVNEILSPCLFYPHDSEVAFEAAKALDVPSVIASWATSGLYSYAYRTYGIPGMILERGWGAVVREEWMDGHQKNIKLLMQHLGMYDWELPKETFDHRIFTRSVYLEADQAGIWYPDAKTQEGTFIRKGQELGHLEDFFGNVTKRYYAEGDGFIYYYTGGLTVVEGSALVAYGLTE